MVGVAVELVVLITEYMHNSRDFRRGTIHSPEKPNLLIFGLGFIGAGLVAIGVAGEFRIHTKAGKIETDMRDKTRQLVAIAEGEAARAGERARNAELRTAELLAQIQPRDLSDKQQAAIADAVHPFQFDTRGTPPNINPDQSYLRVLSCLGDIESRRFGQILIAALGRAAFRPEEGQIDCLNAAKLRVGVSISVCDPERCGQANTAPDKMRLFVAALSGSLQKQAGLNVSIRHLGPENNMPMTELYLLAHEGVTVIIGVKPNNVGSKPIPEVKPTSQ